MSGRTALTGRIKEDNDKIEESVSHTVLSIWQRVGRIIFCGKTLGSRVQTISSVICQQKKVRMSLHTTFLTKVFVKSAYYTLTFTSHVHS